MVAGDKFSLPPPPPFPLLPPPEICYWWQPCLALPEHCQWLRDIACQSVFSVSDNRGEGVGRNLGSNKWTRGGNRWQFQPTPPPTPHPTPHPTPCQKSIPGDSLVWLCLNTVNGCCLPVSLLRGQRWRGGQEFRKEQMAQGWQQVTVSAYPLPPPAPHHPHLIPAKNPLLVTAFPGSAWTLSVTLGVPSGCSMPVSLLRQQRWRDGQELRKGQMTQGRKQVTSFSCQTSTQFCWIPVWKSTGDQFQLPNQHTAYREYQCGSQQVTSFSCQTNTQPYLNTSVEVNRWPVSVAKPTHGLPEYQCGSQQVTSFSCQTNTRLTWIPVWKSTGDQFQLPNQHMASLNTNVEVGC